MPSSGTGGGDVDLCDPGPRGKALKASLKILVVAHDFPPGSSVGGKRPSSFCRYLQDHGIQPIVLSVDPRFYDSRDSTLSLPSGTRIERTGRLPDPIKWYGDLRAGTPSGRKRMPGNGSGGANRAAAKAGASSLRQNMAALLNSYREYWSWRPQAVRAGARLARDESITAIISTAPPWVAHLVARRLKRQHGLLWLADFRDEWAADVWTANNLLDWQRAQRQRLETRCVIDADLVICNTEGMRKNFIRRYPDLPETKFVTLTNGYDDPEAVSGGSLPNPSGTLEFAPGNHRKRMLLHLGELYYGRRIDSFCQAVSGLIDSSRLDRESITVLFQGGAEHSIVAAAENAAPGLIGNGCIQFRPRVDWNEGQQLLERADLLLIIQGDHPAVPAKFYEYLHTGKPIFAIVQQGPLTELLQETGSGLWADPRNPELIADRLLQALALPRRSQEEVIKVAGKFHYRTLTGQLAQWIWQLAQARRSECRWEA